MSTFELEYQAVAVASVSISSLQQAMAALAIEQAGQLSILGLTVDADSVASPPESRIVRRQITLTDSITGALGSGSALLGFLTNMHTSQFSQSLSTPVRQNYARIVS